MAEDDGSSADAEWRVLAVLASVVLCWLLYRVRRCASRCASPQMMAGCLRQ